MSHKAHKRLSSWQKATALVPLALLSGAWTTSLAVTSSATAATDGPSRLPDGTTVPTEALEAPASVSQPGSIAPGVPEGGGASIIASSSTNGIPSAALAAYQRAEQVINAADPGCNLSWQLVAAIGRVESDHGRYGGNTLTDEGKSTPGIYGIPLDGSNGTAEIRDSDAGRFDDDQVYDRAVGPMQFIPGTWAVVGVDGDGDGTRDPQDIDDAALATAVYLCSGDEDLATYGGQKAAVYRYNHSSEYVDLVISIMNAYLDGDFSSVPNGIAAPTVFSPSTPSAVGAPAGTRGGKTGGKGTAGGGSTSGSSGGSGGGTVGDNGGDGGGSTPDGGTDEVAPDPVPEEPTKDPVESTKDAVEDTVKDTTGTVEDTTDKVTKPTDEATGGTLSYAEAEAQCIAEGVLALNLDACIADKLG
ncbi:lytic murein transglycosylase [Nocardioides sp. WL0053]|uniref:Lytic murein transglycosylase n=1 Tax=Nocardioides jiangsuensis TaxID=2866161 RepID=A0ABS7RHN3_9ACTN|nr:lytic murein transglycosylase [Nocardioides jiangsuensis]MBY9074548.1 lytic murein transglycosylase [Nocardioides jiangsuensis]